VAPSRSFRVVLLVGLLCGPSRGGASDKPLPGTILRLQRSAGGEKMLLVLNDPSIPVPAQGSPDNPAATAGLRIMLFGHDVPGEMAEVTAPAGLGRPGWKYGSTGFVRYRFRNGAAPGGISPIRSVVLREGKGLRVVARAVGLALAGPQGSVGVRIEMGSIRLCALFAGSAVLRDQASLFLAKSAPAPGLVECTDEGLFGVPCDASATCGGTCPDGAACGGDPGLGLPCSCIAANQPCGDTAPVCNGTCPTGEECANVGGVPYPGCGCLPPGSVGCGTVSPTCGDGACPAGTSCFTTTFTCCGGFTITGCGCATEPPPPPCGGPCPPGGLCTTAPGFPEACYPITCDGPGTCPSGSECVPYPEFAIDVCAPIACIGGSGYPTCDGTCDTGLSCQGFVQNGGACYCAP
jgi:hypothetical protein